MAIGTHKPGFARGTTLKEAIHIALDEALTALEEAVTGLTNEQALRHPIEGRHNVVTLFMHCVDNLDVYTCGFQAGRRVAEHAERFNVWRLAEEGKPIPTDNLPTVREMLASLSDVRETAMAALAPVTEVELRGPRFSSEWWSSRGCTAADAYMRTTMHTMAHVRQIWFLRGAMGLTDAAGWPEQHWA
jgi:hypothetical protein